MKIRNLLQLSALVLLSGASTLWAQDQTRLLLGVQAVAHATTESGRIVTRLLSGRQLVNDCAQSSGINHRQLALVYHLGGDFNGDTIEVVRATNGVMVCQPYRLLFGNSLTNANGLRVEQLAFVFNNTQSDPIGSAIIHKQTNLDRNGNFKSLSVNGWLQFFSPAVTNEGITIWAGTFRTGRPLNITPE